MLFLKSNRGFKDSEYFHGFDPQWDFFYQAGAVFALLVVSLISNQTKTKTFSGKLLFNDVLCGRDTELNVSVPFRLVEASC